MFSEFVPDIYKKTMEKIREELPEKEIKAVWENPKTKEKKEIILNIDEEIKYFKDFYEKHGLETEINEKEVKQIWQRNKKEIQKEMATYGYDTLLLIPEKLPSLEKLNQKLIETMKEPKEGRVNQTWQSANFKEGGSFAGVKNTEKPKTRIVLTKNVQNLNNDPILNVTLGKDMMQLTGLSKEEVQKRIQNQEPLELNFETTINNQKIKIQSGGPSLEEYLIFQRKYFEKNKKHLDEWGWTWLSGSLSGSRVVLSSWCPDDRQINIHAYSPGDSSGISGIRLFRSFS